jgi:hypothetical protein
MIRLRERLAERLSPEHTRKATLLERWTVRKLDWEPLVRLHRYLELLGKVATAVWVGFIATVVLGVDWKSTVEHTVNSGDPVEAAVALAIALATLAFLAVRSVLGFAHWRIQRELWRRDVERLRY